MKILLIDDEESILNVLSISLKSDGYDIVTAFSGEESLEIFKEERPDIVLTDLKMPGMNGIEVLRRMKQINPDSEVIIITGHGDMDSAIEALQLGASDFINKPIRDDALAVALDRAEQKLSIRKKLEEYTKDLEDMVRIATEEVRTKSEFQAKLISSSTEGIVATDQMQRVIIYNPGAERIFGYKRTEVVGEMSASDLLSPEQEREITKLLASKEKAPGFPWREVTIIAKDGEEIPARVSGATLFENKNVIGYVAFIQDLREIKQLEHELVRTEWLAAMGQTVAGLAHYIKNILTGLKGGSYVANIGFDKKDFRKLGQGWQMLQKNIGRISDLVMNLLTYSKEREAEYKNCFPNEIVNEVIDLVQGKAGEFQIKITADLDKSIGEVSMDQQTIHRSLLNLVSNAIDACIFDEDTEKKYVVAIKTALEQNNIIRFEVTDNGIGMNEEVMTKLFQSFFSTKMGKGTGLGLLITKKLVEEHGGNIIFTSQLGEGSTFVMRLSYQAPGAGDKIEPNKIKLKK